MAKGDLRCALATPAMMGVSLKPEEFQRLLLSHVGKKDVADELEQKGVIFREVSGSEAPTDPLSPEHFSDPLMRMLLPFLGERSYMSPVVSRRIIRIAIAPLPKRTKEEKDSPLLSKVGAAYNWYRREMVKMASYAPQVVASHPVLLAGVCGIDDSDVFAEKRANDDALGLGVPMASVPLALMYSASLRRDMQQGEDPGLIRRVIAEHPNLSALGIAMLVREAMKDEQVRRVVGNLVREAAMAGKRIWTGGA
jgi:hypothetical protein